MFIDWKLVKNYDAVDAAAELFDGGFKATLALEHYSIARATASLPGVQGGMRYRFRYDSELSDGVWLQVIYTVIDKNGGLLFRAHAENGQTVLFPEGAESVELDVCLFGYAGGCGSISNVTVEKVGPYVPNKVKLAAVMVAGDAEPSIENNIRLCAQRIDAAAAEGADLALLPETYNTRAVKGLKPYEGAAAMDDPAVTMLRDKAIEHHMYVAASVRFKNPDGVISNTIVMFDREGRLVGTYDKCHLTMGEIWQGFRPGNDIRTYDTELGRIGFSICWDRFFPEHARVLFMKNTDIVLNSTASGPYGVKEAHNGYANAAIIVTAQTTADPELTRITGRNGQVLAMADPVKGYAIAEVDVNAVDPVFWLSAPDADTDPRSVYRCERRPDLYRSILQD